MEKNIVFGPVEADFLASSVVGESNKLKRCELMEAARLRDYLLSFYPAG